MWGIYVGCLPAKADEVLAICRDEIARVVADGLTDAELARGKGQVRGVDRARPGGPVLADEPARQVRAGLRAAGAGGRGAAPRSTPSTHDDVRAVAAEILTRPKALAVVGPFDDASAFQS